MNDPVRIKMNRTADDDRLTAALAVIRRLWHGWTPEIHVLRWSRASWAEAGARIKQTEPMTEAERSILQDATI